MTNPVHTYLHKVFKFILIPGVLMTGIPPPKKTIKLCLRIFQCEHFCWHDKYPDDTWPATFFLSGPCTPDMLIYAPL